MQVTLTLDLTEEIIDKLKIFCADTKAKTKVTTQKQVKEESTAENVKSKENANSESETVVPETTAPTEKTVITKTDVRAVALKISKAGKSDVLKEIFNKFGATTLKGIAEADYEALMRELVAVDV